MKFFIITCPRSKASDVLARLGLEPGRYFVVSCHREENVDDDRNLDKFMAILKGLAQEYQVPRHRIDPSENTEAPGRNEVAA